MNEQAGPHPRRRYTVTFTATPWQPDTFPAAIHHQLLRLPAHITHIQITTGPDDPGRHEPRGGDTRWQTPTSP